MAKKTRSVEWLQDTIVGAAFLMKCLKGRYGHDFSDGLMAQVKDFLRDANNVEEATLHRKPKELPVLSDGDY